MPPTRAQPVTNALLTRALERAGVNFTRRDGDHYAVLTSGEHPESYLQCWFLLKQAEKIFRLSCQVQPPILWKRLPEALITSNRYHEQYRFGRLYVTPADEPKAGVTLHFESQIDVTAGVSELFLSTFIASHLASVSVFLAQALRDNQLFASPKLKQARKRTAKGAKKPNHREDSDTTSERG